MFVGKIASAYVAIAASNRVERMRNGNLQELTRQGAGSGIGISGASRTAELNDSGQPDHDLELEHEPAGLSYSRRSTGDLAWGRLG